MSTRNATHTTRTVNEHGTRITTATRYPANFLEAAHTEIVSEYERHDARKSDAIPAGTVAGLALLLLSPLGLLIVAGTASRAARLRGATRAYQTAEGLLAAVLALTMAALLLSAVWGVNAGSMAVAVAATLGATGAALVLSRSYS